MRPVRGGEPVAAIDHKPSAIILSRDVLVRDRTTVQLHQLFCGDCRAKVSVPLADDRQGEGANLGR
jgi:hypothetical protein